MDVSAKSSKRPRLDGGHASKEFCMQIFGDLYNFGVLESALHCDLRHIINGSLRKRPKYGLSLERIERLEGALCVQGQFQVAINRSEDNTVSFKSIDDLKKYLINQRNFNRANFEAVNYYDEKRSTKYTENNKVSQERLTNRCLDLISAAHDVPISPIVLDICCGSGLSSKFACSRLKEDKCLPFVIGIDAAPDMLSIARKHETTAMDFILWDLKDPLPFRKGFCDLAISVSAIHFLCGPKDEVNRSKSFFQELKRVLPTPDSSAFQFFPEQNHVPKLLLDSAQNAGCTNFTLLTDFTHHTKAFRWYLAASMNAKRCILNECSDGMKTFNLQEKSLSCVLCLFDRTEENKCQNPKFKEHLEWSKSNHCKKARTLIRKYKFDRSLIKDEKVLDLTSSLVEVFGESISLLELKERFDELEKFIHLSSISV